MARLDAIKYPPFNGHPLALLEVVRGNSDAHHRGVLRLQGREDFAAGDPGVPRVSRSKAPRYFVKPLGRFLECECCGLSLDMRLPRARLDEPPRRATPADAVREALLYLQRGADLAREVEQLHQARDDVAAVAARLEAQHSESAARVRSLGVEPFSQSGASTSAEILRRTVRQLEVQAKNLCPWRGVKPLRAPTGRGRPGAPWIADLSLFLQSRGLGESARFDVLASLKRAHSPWLDALSADHRALAKRVGEAVRRRAAS